MVENDGIYPESLSVVDGLCFGDHWEDLAELTVKKRNRLRATSFALPGRRYPVHDIAHARAALARVAQHGTPSEQVRVRAFVKKRYPGIGR